MALGIGSYKTTDALIDRTGYGAVNGLVVGGTLGGGYVATTMMMGAKGKSVLNGATRGNLAIGAIIGASAFTSVLASHVWNGNADSRQIAAVAGAAIPAAAGAALLTWNSTHNPLTTGLTAAGALVGAGLLAFVASPAFVSR